MEMKAGGDSDEYWSRQTLLKSVVFGICGV